MQKYEKHNYRVASRRSVDGKPAVSGRHRPRASIACNNCRTRKVKCDVQKLMDHGTCTKCRVSNVQCIVSHDDDRRRYGSYHHIAALKDRLQSLESMMVHHFHRTSEAASEQSPRPDEHEHKRSSSSPAVPRSDTVPSSPCTDVSRMPSSHTAEPNHPFSTPATELSAVEAEDPNPNPSPSSIPSTPSGGMNNQHSLAQMTAGPAHGQLLCHDSDISLGQIQCYRPSTQLGMQSQPAEEDVGNETALNLDSSQVQKMLLEIAWRYLSLQTRLVHEQYFLSHYELGVRTQYYSKFLENTLLACASRASTSTAIRNLQKSYIDRAVKDIPMELEYPTLATVGGFLLLADCEATRGRDRLGWTYMGIACRLLLFDLGPDRCEPLATKDDLISCDAQSRYTVYFSTFVYDTLWSLYLGRPRTISLPMLCDARGSIQHTIDNRILHAWVNLCVHIAEVSDIVNNTSHSRASHSMAQLLVLDSRLQNTYEALPLDLAYRQMATAELDAAGYAYHMQFYSTKIVLHRALIKSSLGGETFLPEGDPSTSGIFRQYTPDSSSKNMYESAVCITELTVTYRQIFGLDKMIPVMLNSMYMAAITLINHVLLVLQHHQGGAQAESDIWRIRQLVDTLDQVQKHFPVAFRMCHTLSEILSGTSLAFLVDCMPLSLQHVKPSSPVGAITQVNSWGAMGTPVENHALTQVSMDFSGMLDERYQPWIPDTLVPELNSFN